MHEVYYVFINAIVRVFNANYCTCVRSVLLMSDWWDIRMSLYASQIKAFKSAEPKTLGVSFTATNTISRYCIDCCCSFYSVRNIWSISLHHYSFEQIVYMSLKIAFFVVIKSIMYFRIYYSKGFSCYNYQAQCVFMKL